MRLNISWRLTRSGLYRTSAVAAAKFTPADSTPGMPFSELSMLCAQSAQSMPPMRSFSLCIVLVVCFVSGIVVACSTWLWLYARFLLRGVSRVLQADSEQCVYVG